MSAATLNLNPHSPVLAAPQDDPFIWDAHTCVPLRPWTDLSFLERHRAAGVRYVQLNVGMDDEPWHFVLRLLTAFRGWLSQRPDQFILAHSLADVARARTEGKLAVGFDFEGSNMVGPDPDALLLFRDLGVRQMHLAYNRNNAAAGGCWDDDDRGLTPRGRALVKAANRYGVVMDVSHSSRRTSLEVMEASERPVVFSHSNARALTDHPRNITDEQIRACAAVGGVIGVTGIGVFLGDPQARTETLMRHLDYMVQTVGPEHVGIGLDYVYGGYAEAWSPYGVPDVGDDDIMQMVGRDAAPEQLPQLIAAMRAAGYGEDAVRMIAGGNFLRVATAVWGDSASDPTLSGAFTPLSGVNAGAGLAEA